VTTRGLAVTAALLGLMLVVAGVLWARRLGRVQDWQPMELVFENPLLTAQRGQQVRIRPILQGGDERRYWFATIVTEPDPDDPVYAAPHLRVGASVRRPPATEFVFASVQYLALSQLGALTTKEWLEQITLVRERGNDGKERTLIRAGFGHESGGAVAYFTDPEHPVPGLGWFRTEMIPMSGPPQVHYATPDGVRLP